ncbi:ATP-dependent DNA ligase [Aeromonas phage vB_AsaP_MQM1]|nr:ATP-dependent DNA ligase [Aeromonas phage vB_AsaP_MQM1]
METIYSWLRSHGIQVEDRDEDHTAMYVLENDKMSGAQQKLAIGSRYLVQEKLDGVFSFVAVVYRDGQYRSAHFGRSGKKQPGCEAFDELLCQEFNRVSRYGGERSGVYISEVTSDAALAVLSGYLNPNRVGPASAPAGICDTFHDWMNVVDFCDGICHKEAHYRREYLCRMQEGTTMKVIGSQTMTFGDGQAFGRYLIQKLRKEGAVLKLTTGTWEAGKRDYRQVKVKEKLSYDVTVVGMCSGKEGTKYEHTLGKLLVLFRAFGDSRGKPLVVPVSGMTDTQRNLWWEHPELIIGQCVKMDAKSFTEFGNLREPRFKEVRGDKSSEFPCIVDVGVMNQYTKAKCLWVEYHYCIME